ncbi:MAG: glycosyltransferase family 2 protein [Lachnospiraceae bacterium]|nr:glycosyltransferase family 2 protein [Lachnospiraceae bacterium]
MDKKVQILMSTYNGERFIRKQLDSIINQNYKVSLLVRDDGSTDSTIEIIKEYGRKYDFITLVEGENIGVVKSFFELIRISDSEADYYSFADQDDIWFEGKIARAVEKLEKMDEEKPCLYCSRQTLIDSEDNILNVKMKEVHIRPGFGNAIVENIATGCTCVMNKKLRDLAAKGEPDYTIMHDWWLYLLASYMGEVYFDNRPQMYYRQHGSNTMGSRTNYIEEFRERVRRFSANKNKLYRQLSSFDKKFRAAGEEKKIVDMVLGHKESLSKRIRCIFSRKIYRQRKLDNFIFKILFLTNHI